MGVWAPYQTAYNLREKIGEFLKNMKLELSFEKTKITNTKRDRAKFLGTNITRVASDHNIKMRINNLGRRVRIPTGQL